MKYKAICFDVDGTLYPAAFEHMIEFKMGFWHPILGKRYSDTRNEFRKCQSDFRKYDLENKPFGDREAAMLCKVAKPDWSIGKSRRYLDRKFYSILHKHFNKLPYQANVVETFKRLKSRGYIIGIMSDWPLWEKLERIGVAEYCDFKCDPDQMQYLKPDVRTFEYLLYNLKLEPSEVLYVGDSYEKDIEGATNAGIDSVLVNREDNGNYPKALKVFRNWDDFSFWMEAN